MSDKFKDFEFRNSTVYPDRTEIEIKSGEYSGVVYTIGEVSFPDESEPILRFHYDIVSDHNFQDKQLRDFEKFIGDTLVEMIHDYLEKGKIVYKGGT